MMTPGSIVEPGDIKWFKTRLRDRDVIEVHEQDLDKWEAYFNVKFGVSIKANIDTGTDTNTNTDTNTDTDTGTDIGTGTVAPNVVENTTAPKVIVKPN